MATVLPVITFMFLARKRQEGKGCCLMRLCLLMEEGKYSLGVLFFHLINQNIVINQSVIKGNEIVLS